jgi:hypothetical protein
MAQSMKEKVFFYSRCLILRIEAELNASQSILFAIVLT